MKNSERELEEYLNRINSTLFEYGKNGLSEVQEFILINLWDDPTKPYYQISSSNYSHSYIKQSASNLWKTLEEIVHSKVKTKVNKINFRSAIKIFFTESIPEYDSRKENFEVSNPKIGRLKNFEIFSLLSCWKTEKDCIYSAPGATFLGGEHSVVYGHPAIYLPIPLRLYIGITRDFQSDSLTVGTYQVPDPNNIDKILNIENIDDYGRCSVVEHREFLDALFYKSIFPFMEQKSGLIIDVISEFPLAVGLNSSGAFSTCLAQALIENYINLNAFSQEFKFNSPERATLILAWAIGNCFHKLSASGAGVHASYHGRKGTHPLIYCTAKRSKLNHRIDSGYHQVTLGSPDELIRCLSNVKTFIFDPSELINGLSLYPKPPEYNITILYSGAPSQTGTVLSEKGMRKFSASISDRVEYIRDKFRQSISASERQKSLDFHSEEILKNIYLNSELSSRNKSNQLLNAYKELISDALGKINIGILNSVLSDWSFVPELMIASQSLLSTMGVSDPKTDYFNSILQSVALKSQVLRGGKEPCIVGSKLTGAGKGGDIVILSLCSLEKHISFVEYSRKELTKSFIKDMPIHFQANSTDTSEEIVDGVRREN